MIPKTGIHFWGSRSRPDSGHDRGALMEGRLMKLNRFIGLVCPECAEEQALNGVMTTSHPREYGGSTRLHDTVFRYKSEPDQARRNGADFALMRRCNCRDRIARLERST